MEETSENILKTVVSKIDDLYSIEKKKAQNINILTILGKDSEEVVMCKILWAILNYEENNEKIFLHSFFSDVLKTDTSEDELAAADVLREYCIPQSNRRIDIVIKTKKRFIPIEAKIFAGDQKNQCADYLEYADGCNGGKGKTVLYYLTTNNSKPTYYSVSGNEKLYQQIKSISWVDIHDWLDKRRNISDGAAEVVGQYVKALDSLLDLKKGGYNMSIDNLIDVAHVKTGVEQIPEEELVLER